MRRLVACALVLVVAGCGAGHQLSPSVFAAPTTTTAAPSTGGSAAQACGDPTASTRPVPGNPVTGFVATIRDRGKLRAATSPDQELFGFVNPVTGQLEGLDVDVIRAVAAAIFGINPADTTAVDAHIQFVTVTLAQRIPKIQDGSVDIVADTMTITCSRRTMVDFSSVYYQAGQKVLVRKNSGVTNVAALRGQRVCAAAKSTSVDNLNALHIPFQLVEPADQSDCLVMFQQGLVDAISTDDTVLAGLAVQDPYAQVVGPPFSQEPYGMAISLKHPELTQFVNGVLDAMRAGGGLQGLYQRWLGSVFTPLPPVPAAKYRD